MSIYSEISKKIGWGAKTVSIPSMEEANEIFNAVGEKDLSAFEKAFTIYRYAPSPKDEMQERSLQIIFHAYKLGADYPEWR